MNAQVASNNNLRTYLPTIEVSMLATIEIDNNMRTNIW